MGPAGDAPGSNRLAAIAGLGAPSLFVSVVLVQFLYRADHDPVAWPMSALAAGPTGWVQSLNFVLTGSLVIAFAFGLHRAVAPGRGGPAGPGLLGVAGAGMLWAAAFPLGTYDAPFDPAADPGLHPIGGLVFFGGTALGLIVTSLRLRDDPAWRDCARAVRGTGIVAGLIFVAGPTLVIPDDAPLHAYAGVSQALFVAAWALALASLGARARRLDAQA